MPASGRGRKRPRGGETAALPPLPHDRQKRFRGAGAASSATLFPRPQRPFPRHGPSGNTLPQTARCTCPPFLRRAPFSGRTWHLPAPFSPAPPSNAPSRRKKAAHPPDFPPATPLPGALLPFSGHPSPGALRLPGGSPKPPPAGGFRLLLPPSCAKKMQKIR